MLAIAIIQIVFGSYIFFTTDGDAAFAIAAWMILSAVKDLVDRRRGRVG